MKSITTAVTIETWQNHGMDGKLLNLTQQLQVKLESLDPQHDRETLVWAHGFLTSVVRQIESTVPDLVTPKTLLESVRSNLDSIDGTGLADPDSLDLIDQELDSPSDAPVPAKPKPGPKGLSGGAALRLPDSELPM